MKIFNKKTFVVAGLLLMSAAIIANYLFDTPDILRLAMLVSAIVLMSIGAFLNNRSRVENSKTRKEDD